MKKVQYFAFVNREVRHVPLDWEHPRDEHGGLPLPPRDDLNDDLAVELPAKGEARSREEIEREYMPAFSAVPLSELGIQAYETTTEGTPISPVFSDTPQGRFALVQHCAEQETVFGPHMADMHEWARILFGEKTVAVNVTTGTIDRLEETARSN